MIFNQGFRYAMMRVLQDLQQKAILPTMLYLSIVTILLYLAAGVVQSLRLGGKLSEGKPAVLVCGALAVLLHAYLLHRWIDTAAGQNLALMNIVSLVFWTSSLLVTFTMMRNSLENLVIFLYPLASISIILVLMLPGKHVIDTGDNPKQLTHILLAILAFSVFCTAALQAVLLAIQDRLLRSKHPSRLMLALPSIETMETLLFQIILVGFILLSLLIFSSMVIFHNLFSPTVVHETILSILAWLVFAILLWGRYYLGWRGRTAIRWTIAGVVLLMLAFFGSRYLIGLLV